MRANRHVFTAILGVAAHLSGMAAGSVAVADTRLEACGVLGPLTPGDATGTTCTGTLTGGSKPDAAQCPTAFDPWAGLSFDDDLHRRWYARFWTGLCEGFGFLDMCVEDGNNWPRTVELVTRDEPASDIARARAEWNAVGRMVGFEWARRNNVRKISTGELQDWRDMVQAEPDQWRALRTLCDLARDELGVAR